MDDFAIDQLGVAAHYEYAICIGILMVGLYTMISSQNLMKKLIGLSLFQVAISLFYITVGKVLGGSAPILDDHIQVYSNPLPHVLILTAIVVGVATLSVGLALLVRIYNAYDSIDEATVNQVDRPS